MKSFEKLHFLSFQEDETICNLTLDKYEQF